jgi:hypothetical protein
MKPRFNKGLIYTVVSALIIILGAYIAIRYAQGGFRVTDQGISQGTGLLSANSFPTGAEVYVDGKLVAATDDTLYLEPGQYSVEIKRDGYNSWLKNISIEEALVAQTNARLFPIAPSLTPLTFTGVQNIYPSPDGTKIVYYAASASAERKNGLYVLQLSDSPLSFQQGSKQIAANAAGFDLASAKFIWSPDSTEIMMIAEDRQVMLQTDRLQNLESLPDIFPTRRQILTEWEREMFIREQQYLEQFPPEVIEIAIKSAKNAYLSPDKKRLMYTATQSAVVPDTIVPPIPATNTQPEERQLAVGGIYIYDREEDKNFRIGSEASDSGLVNQPNKQLLVNSLGASITSLNDFNTDASNSAFTTLQASEAAQTADNFRLYHSSMYTNTFQWYPDSRHLFYVEDNSIKVMEYDGTNITSLYSGPFDKFFVYPWPDGNRLIIKTLFSLSAPDNLYTLELR